MYRLIPLLAASLAFAVYPAGAGANSPLKCWGEEATTAGTNDDDSIGLGYEDNVTHALDGEDFVRVDEDSDSASFVCLGKDDDRFGEPDQGSPVNRLHGGPGDDEAIVQACFDNAAEDRIEIRKVESVTIVPCVRPQDGR